MTRLQVLKNELDDAKRLMKFNKPLSSYLGNQYYYWKSETERLQIEMEQLKNKN